jgi:hypothetical protein
VLLAREGEELLRQARRAVDGAKRRLDEAPDHRCAAGLRPQHLQISRDHREEIVEIVRDPAGEMTDGLHLLRLAQGILGASPLLALGEKTPIGVLEPARAVGDALLERLIETLQRGRRPVARLERGANLVLTSPRAQA